MAPPRIRNRILDAVGAQDELTGRALIDLAARLGMDVRHVRRHLEIEGWESVYTRREKRPKAPTPPKNVEAEEATERA